MGAPAWRFTPYQEDLSSQISGDNQVFNTTLKFTGRSLQVFRNGQKIIKDDDDDGFSILTKQSLRLNFIPSGGEKIVVTYFRSS
jgi:hypothetical protein